MQKNQMIKMAVLNTCIALINILVFSEGFVGLSLKDGPLEAAMSVTLVFVSLGVFVIGNKTLLSVKTAPVLVKNLESPEDCINALRNVRLRTFEKDLETILLQTDRFTHKKMTIRDILLQKFEATEMSYVKFDQAVNQVEKVFYMNVKSILNRLNAFDEPDYLYMKQPLAKKKFSETFIESKLTIYKEYIDFVREAVEDNEEILLKLDKLLFEISKFNSFEIGEIETMDAMVEIDELINKTKFYR